MPPRADTPPQANSNLGLVLALALCIILAMRVLLPRIAEFLNQRFDPWAPRSKTVTESAEQLREDEAFARFTARFGTGAPEPRGGAEGVRSTESSEDVQLPGPPGAAANPLRDFLAAAPENLERLRALLQDIVRAPNDAMQRTLVLRLRGELQRLAGLADVREVLPVWQLTYALECLAWHLSEKTERVTASTLRTIAAGLDIVEKLCQAGVRSDLCGNPPIRLLAVDDELFSRRAIALALKQGVAQPDLAESAAEALALAEKQPYDVIFLDVEMPGMDGYELCKRIRATPTNATTPVVFVTLHSKFDERAKSIMAGGSDLIAKPFLLFELTVKALTVALARRLEQPRPQQTAGESADPASQAVSVAATPVTPAPVCS